MSDLNLKILDDKIEDDSAQTMRDHTYIGTVLVFMVLYRLVWKGLNFAVKLWAAQTSYEFYASFNYRFLIFFLSSVTYIFPVLIALRLKNENLKGLILALCTVFFIWDLIGFIVSFATRGSSLFQF